MTRSFAIHRQRSHPALPGVMECLLGLRPVSLRATLYRPQRRSGTGATVRFPGGIEIFDSPPQAVSIDVILVATHAPLQVMLARRSRLPYDLHSNLPANALLVEHDLADDEA